MPNPRNPPPKNSNHAVRSVHPMVRESGGYTIEFWLKLLDTASVPADNADWSARETAMRRIVFFTRVSPPRVLASLCLRSMRVCCSRIRPNHISTALTENEPALYVCMHVSMSMSMNPYMYVCMCVCVCVCARAHTHTHIHTYIHTQQVLAALSLRSVIDQVEFEAMGTASPSSRATVPLNLPRSAAPRPGDPETRGFLNQPMYSYVYM